MLHVLLIPDKFKEKQSSVRLDFSEGKLCSFRRDWNNNEIRRRKCFIQEMEFFPDFIFSIIFYKDKNFLPRIKLKFVNSIWNFLDFEPFELYSQKYERIYAKGRQSS